MDALAMWHANAMLREQYWTHIVDEGANDGEMMINSHHHPMTALPCTVSDLVGLTSPARRQLTSVTLQVSSLDVGIQKHAPSIALPLFR